MNETFKLRLSDIDKQMQELKIERDEILKYLGMPPTVKEGVHPIQEQSKEEWRNITNMEIPESKFEFRREPVSNLRPMSAEAIEELKTHIPKRDERFFVPNQNRQGMQPIRIHLPKQQPEQYQQPTPPPDFAHQYPQTYAQPPYYPQEQPVPQQPPQYQQPMQPVSPQYELPQQQKPAWKKYLPWGIIVALIAAAYYLIGNR
jgi:hypothetical protein